MTTIDQLLCALAEVAPAIGDLEAEHLREYGELLPHVLFGDLTRWILAHQPQDRVLQVLEASYASGDADARDLIAASFVENIEPTPEHAHLRDALGPNLRSIWNATYS